MLSPGAGSGPASVGHPLWMCGMRPFFAATALAAVALMLQWILFLLLGVPVPASASGPGAWHAHELLYGVALASVAGFLLTAVPEFTGTPDFPPSTVRRLALLWVAARAAFWAGGPGGAPLVIVSGGLHLGLIGALAAQVAPRLWRDPGRGHLSFVAVLAALAACEGAFHLALVNGAAMPSRWLHASVGVYMILVVLAMSRISMRIVNQAIEDAGASSVYLARPPRRNLAIVCIGLATVAELAAPGTRLSGWVALAAAAAVLNLLNDWHVGRALLHRQPLMLYAAYACMGLGYLLMGLGLVAQLGSFHGGRHLLTVGALGLAVLAAMTIAGRAHCGLPADARAWVPVAAASLVLAALLRAAAGWLLPATPPLWATAGVLWCLAFGLYAWHMLPVLASARVDGHGGCHGSDARPGADS